MNIKKTVRGFTLIELLVSITIIGIMSIILFYSFNISLKASEKSKDIINNTIDAKNLMEKTKSDIKNTYSYDPGINALKNWEVYDDNFTLKIVSTKKNGLYSITITHCTSKRNLTSYIYLIEKDE